MGTGGSSMSCELTEYSLIYRPQGIGQAQVQILPRTPQGG